MRIVPAWSVVVLLLGSAPAHADKPTEKERIDTLHSQVALEVEAARKRGGPPKEEDRARVDDLVKRMESDVGLLYPLRTPAERDKILAGFAEHLYGEHVGRIIDGKGRSGLLPLKEANALVQGSRPLPGAPPRFVATPTRAPKAGDLVIIEWNDGGAKGYSRPMLYSEGTQRRIAFWNTVSGAGSHWPTRVILLPPAR
ncbi:MAG: hypothetical protein HY078_07455 [Elusimicrobia bacterium]|nr:hypothetical protein [Elusimicrobiota bacterium]